jgi:polyisoprenoid-binding protein YceI
MKLFRTLGVAAAGLLAIASLSAAELNLDKSHTKVQFTVSHMVVSSVTGRFSDYTGNFAFDSATRRLTAANVSIKVASINTEDEKRDEHLVGADFFDAENHPEITFRIANPATLRLNGATNVPGFLKIRGVEKPVTLSVIYRGSVKDPWGNTRHGFQASVKINRRDFGVNWDMKLDNGGLVVGNEVEILIIGEAVEKPAGG